MTSGKIIAEHPADPPHHGFNPHRISTRPSLNLMVTSDFICPTSTLNAVPGGLDLRGGIRVWDLKRRAIVRSVNIPGAGGTIDAKLITLNQAGKVIMFDTSKPSAPRVLSTLDLGAGSGPHYLRLTDDEKRLVISDYFLDEDSLGEVHAEGDHKIHVVKVTGKAMALDPRFRLDFNTAFASGRARPHGLAFK